MKKLTSRKFWVAISQIVAGFLIVFNFTDNTATVISGAIVSLSSAIIYIVTEGKIDAASVSQAASDVQTAVETVKEDPIVKERLTQI